MSEHCWEGSWELSWQERAGGQSRPAAVVHAALHAKAAPGEMVSVAPLNELIAPHAQCAAEGTHGASMGQFMAKRRGAGLGLGRRERQGG